MALFTRQIVALTIKNLLIALVRHRVSTPFRAFLLPCILIGFLSYARNLFIPPSVFGIGEPTLVRSLPAALELTAPSRNKVVFVNNGNTGGDIERVINAVIEPIRTSGKQIEILTREDDLLTTCRNSIRGTSTCVAAAVFFSSPDEGGHWNYSIRADGALDTKIVTDSTKNDAEIYTLPLQHAVDFAIANLNNTVDTDVYEYPYTSLTAAQRKERIRTRYMGGIIEFIAVTFFIGMVGVGYQLTGLIATERENGMAQLLDCMMPNRARWQPQMARIISNHLAFDLVYGPGWIVMAIIMSIGVFSKTSKAIMIIFNILAGLSMSSLSVFGAAFFHKAQLSGISVVVIALLLAIVAQVAHNASTAAVAILSLLFPPMNYVYFIIFLARWERQDLGANLVKSAPQNPSTLPGIVLWIFLVIQIFALPVLGKYVEIWLYGTDSKERRLHHEDSETAVSLTNFTKEYRHFRKSKNVLAVDDVTLTALKGQIMVLLGANGSGKSTTLDAISGLTKITSGQIDVYLSGDGGLGLCPQRNVLWDELTVREHTRIFSKIKSVREPADITDVLVACDIHMKADERSKALSGGHKRKLQLAMMFAGGSSICCVDEVSSGLDPISRRKIWDILLAERGRRSIILTTHFLDEADLLSDYIAILSKGSLRAAGTAVELKTKQGSGYRVHVYQDHVTYAGVPSFKSHEKTLYHTADSVETSRFIDKLEKDGITEYQVNGPTVEDVFLKVAEEVDHEQDSTKDGEVTIRETYTNESKHTPELLTGHQISQVRQATVLFRKRATVLRRNYFPSVAALMIPIIAAGLVTLYLKNFQKAECSPESNAAISEIESLASQFSYDLVVGPTARLTPSVLEQLASTISPQGVGSVNASGLADSLHFVDTITEFHDYIDNHFGNVTPGGFFIGPDNSATFAWLGNGDISFATIMQNAVDNLATNVSIGTQYQAFDQPWGASVGDALLLITYFGLAMAVYPAFFALYPTVEKLRNVRELHYSNGVRSLPLWLAYVSFDFIIVVITSAVSAIIFRAAADVWYYLGYAFLIFMLYGLASTLLSYVISLFSRSQLSAFAFAAGGQTVMFLMYYIAYMSILTYSPIEYIDRNVNIAHFVISAVSPIANLLRTMFTTLNVFSMACRGRAFASYPGGITVYGGPILYLILQSFFLFGVLLWWDSGPVLRRFRRARALDLEEKDDVEKEVSQELARVVSSHDGLRVLHLTKQFNKNLAVDDVTFGVPRGSVFALLGPNGAGKSTIISLIRGDIEPSSKSEIFVEDVSVIRRRAKARTRLGVCPQYDAIDTLTVQEHLSFYANVRGVDDPAHNVREVLKAVGLVAYADRMAAKLSGGNMRKLSLGIALMGNPGVLLLDEPSSGMDAAIKRVMWRTLMSVVPGRSLVLTTHSMEEADALAQRAGIVCSRMLAIGTTDELRRRNGEAYYVHVIHRNAPRTSPEDMDRIRQWALTHFPGVEIEHRTYHGQLRFSVPTAPVGQTETEDAAFDDDAAAAGETIHASTSTISSLFDLLEQSKEALGILYYSVSRATLDQLFLSLVAKYHMEEEGLATAAGSKRRLSLFKGRGRSQEAASHPISSNEKH